MEVLDNGVMQARGGRPGAKHKARKCETNFTLICAQPTLDGKAIFYGNANPFFLEMRGNFGLKCKASFDSWTDICTHLLVF